MGKLLCKKIRIFSNFGSTQKKVEKIKEDKQNPEKIDDGISAPAYLSRATS